MCCISHGFIERNSSPQPVTSIRCQDPKIRQLQPQKKVSSQHATPRQHGFKRDSEKSSVAAPGPAIEEQPAAGDNPTFKRFITKDGEEYTVFVREDGKLFYVDWEQQKWRVFPSEWCEHGTFELIQSYVSEYGKLCNNVDFCNRLQKMKWRERENSFIHFVAN